MDKLFARIRKIATAFIATLEGSEFLQWLSGTEDVSKIDEIARLGRELDYVAERPPACDAAWVVELKGMKDKKRYRAPTLIAIIDRLIPVVVTDTAITASIRTDTIERMQSIQDRLRQLSTRTN